MDQLKFAFASDEEFDLSILDKIPENLPGNVNSREEFHNLTGYSSISVLSPELSVDVNFVYQLLHIVNLNYGFFPKLL